MKQRKKLYLAISRHLATPNKLMLAALPLLVNPLLAQAETTEKWHCGANESGQWECSIKSVDGRHYERPEHATQEATPEDEGPVVRRAKNLDWVDEKYLTEEERTTLRPGCCGAYVEPERDYEDSDLDPEDATLRVAAASTEIVGENIAKLDGGVQLTQGYRQIRGDTATLDQKNRIAEITGDVQYREPGILLKGERAKINLDTKDLEVDKMSYLFHEAGVRGTADRFERRKEDIFYIENATYTSCEPGNDAWRLDSGSLKLNRANSMATVKNVRLKVKGVPIIYLPWLMFPVGDERTTGLLFPHLSYDADNGLDYGQPIYLNLAPNYDMTITPRYVQERGTALELEGRYLSKVTDSLVGGGFLADDNGGADQNQNERLYNGEDRWVAQIEHEGGFGKRWRTDIDYSRVSDIDYFRDLDTAALDVRRRTHLTEKASVGYKFRHWDTSITAQQYQTISDSPFVSEDYSVIPKVDINGYYQLGDFIATLNNQFGSFDHKDKYDRFGRPLPVGERVHTDYNLLWENEWQWGFFKPKAGFHHISYDLSNTVSGEESPSATIPVVSIDSGIYLERNTSWLGDFIQTFEPRLYGLYAKFEDQSDFPEFDTTERTFSYGQLFRDNRFIGGDRVGDAEQVSVGLTTRFLQPESGKEVFRASLGQAFYLDDRKVALFTTLPETLEEDKSTYAGELAFTLGDYWRFTSSVLFDEQDSVVEKGSIYLGYDNENRTLFNLGYRYTRKNPRFDLASNRFIDSDIEQADISTYQPISGNWNLVARWNYDFTNGRDLDLFAGVEYNSCCWRVSVLARRWLDRNDRILIPEDDLTEDNGIFFQIQFKGLGSTSKTLDSIIADGIIGYEIPE